MNKKLKVAIIGSRGYPYVYSGYETLVKELSERLILKNYYITVYCHKSLYDERPRYINGIKLIYTPSVKLKILSQIYNSFFSFIHACFSDYDIILVLNSANGPFGILTKIFGKKTCINVDGMEWLRPKWRGFGSVYYKISSKLATILFDQVITDSYEMKKIYLKKFDSDSEVIAYGHTMIESSNNNILDKYKLLSNDYFLIVGRLIPDNNSLQIINGFLNSKTTKKIVVVGDVPYKDKYADLVKSIKSKNVIFTGYIKNQNDLTQLYRNCYCYIHGHEFGGTNPTLINALYLNLEILALNTIFNVEMLKNKKVIFFSKNINDISNAINEFEKKIKSLKKINKNYTIPDNYLWETIVNKYSLLFKKVVNSKVG